MVDLTNLSDRKIYAAVKAGGVCARLTTAHLGSDLIIPREKNKYRIAASAAVISILTIGNNAIFAQTPVITEQTENKTNDINSISLDVVIQGAVTGSITNEGQPLAGVEIYNKADNAISKSDINGSYSIMASAGDTIKFSYTGMKITEIVVDKFTKTYDVVMESEPEEWIGEVVIAKKRTFFGRIFHGIGNIFR